jgi:hypothetical protein
MIRDEPNASAKADLVSRDSVERELDECHAAAQDAFARRELEAYRAMFSASLR